MLFSANQSHLSLSADSEVAGLNQNKSLVTQSGRSMIEMLGVLAIIGVLSVGGIAGYTKAMTQHKINKTIDQITHTMGNTRTFYSSQKNYGDLSTLDDSGKNIIKKAHIVPVDMWVGTSSSSIENAFGGTFWLMSVDKSTSGDKKAARIYMTGIPDEACMALLTYDWGSGSSSGLIAIGGSNASIDDVLTGCEGRNDNEPFACPKGSNVSIPMPADIAVKGCSQSDNNEFYIKFY